MSLNRSGVLAAALDEIDADGLDALSMRRLGGRLGVTPMALYQHVVSRDDLLRAVAAGLLADVRQHLKCRSVGPGWQDYVRAVAGEVRAASLAHPRAFPLLMMFRPVERWLRPPLHRAELVADLTDTLIGHGFDVHQVSRIYRDLSTFLLGHLTLETVELAAARLSWREAPGAAAPVTASTERLRALLDIGCSTSDFDTGVQSLIQNVATPARRHVGVAS